MVKEVDSCDSQGQLILCDSHLSHRWGLSVTHHPERAGNIGSTAVIQ